MASFTVWKFDTAQGAGVMLEKLEELQKMKLITIDDAATVTWEEGKKKPRTRQAVHLAGVGALEGAFWGLLFGVLFLNPILGLLAGSAVGAMAGKFSDYGISDDLIKEVQENVTEGTSALFLLSENAEVDTVIEEINKLDLSFDLIQSNLTAEQEQNLKESFGEEE